MDSEKTEDGLQQFGELMIRVYDSPEPKKRGEVRVLMGVFEAGKEFKMLMMAAEFLTHLVAQKSHAGYEQALDLIRKGAMTYEATERPDLAEDGGKNGF